MNCKILFRFVLPQVVVGVLATVAFVMTGCAVGPNYQPPKLPMPAAWAPGAQAADVATTQAAARKSTVTAEPAHLAHWWTSFHDPELTSLIARASAQNLTLQAARAAIRQARYSRDVAAANLGPFVSGTAAYQHSRSSNNLSEHGGTASEGDLYQSGFDATWELDVFGGLRRGVEAANDTLQAADDNAQSTLVTLLGEVATDYITLRGAQQEIAVTDQNINAQQQSLDVTRRQFKGGLATELDVANAEAQLATTESELPVLKTQQQQLIYALSILLGLPPQSLAKELIQPAIVPAVPPTVPIGLPAQLLVPRPDVLAAERQLAAATAEIGVATSDLYPKFVINGNIGFAAVDAAQWFNSNSVTWGIGPAVNWSILSSGQVQSNINQQRAIRDQAYFTYRQTVLQALDDVDSAIAAYTREQTHQRTLQQAVTANQRAVTLSMQLYRGGLTNFINVLQAQGALFSTQSALAQSNTSLSNDLVALYKALGGGWPASQ